MWPRPIPANVRILPPKCGIKVDALKDALEAKWNFRIQQAKEEIVQGLNIRTGNVLLWVDREKLEEIPESIELESVIFKIERRVDRAPRARNRPSPTEGRAPQPNVSRPQAGDQPSPTNEEGAARQTQTGEGTSTGEPSERKKKKYQRRKERRAAERSRREAEEAEQTEQVQQAEQAEQAGKAGPSNRQPIRTKVPLPSKVNRPSPPSTPQSLSGKRKERGSPSRNGLSQFFGVMVSQASQFLSFSPGNSPESKRLRRDTPPSSPFSSSHENDEDDVRDD